MKFNQHIEEQDVINILENMFHYKILKGYFRSDTLPPEYEVEFTDTVSPRTWEELCVMLTTLLEHRYGGIREAATQAAIFLNRSSIKLNRSSIKAHCEWTRETKGEFRDFWTKDDGGREGNNGLDIKNDLNLIATALFNGWSDRGINLQFHDMFVSDSGLVYRLEKTWEDSKKYWKVAIYKDRSLKKRITSKSLSQYTILQNSRSGLWTPISNDENGEVK